jgi:DNA polymerase (family 10)
MKDKSGNTLYPRQLALQIAEKLLKELAPVTEQIVIAGSIRRKRKLVHDIEILYIPKVEDTKEDMFEPTPVDLAEEKLQQLIKEGILAQRYTRDGHATWGKQNKLARHVKSDIPVDFFATTQLNWFNSLVVRTGGKQTNIAISEGALKKGWSFEAYGSGFHKTEDKQERHDSSSERDVFQFAGLEYLDPEDRK